MPKVSPIQNAFVTGEIGPLAYGRVDVDRYKQALEVCENWIPLLQGPVVRRPGTKFVHPVRHPAKETDIFPFKYSRSDSYVIERGIMDEFSNTYFRFFKNNSILVQSNQTVTAVSASSPVSVTCPSHGLFTGSRVILSGISGMTELNNREFIVATVSANVFTINSVEATASIDGTSYSPYVSGGVASAVYEVVGRVQLGSTLYSMRYAQSGDVIFVTEPDNPFDSPYKISRYSDTSWTVADVQITDGPYLAVNDTTSHVIVHGGVGSVPLEFSSAAPINNGAGFSASDIGRPIRIQIGSVWGNGTITTVGSSTSVTVQSANYNTVSTPTVTTFRLGAYRLGQYPSGVTFHDSRLWFIGGIDTQMVAGSTVDNYTRFSPDTGGTATTDSDAVTFLLASSEANKGQWLMSDEQGLICGTAGGPWIIRPFAVGDALTTLGAFARQITSFGSSDAQPIKIDKATLYIQSSGKTVRELVYYYNVDGFRASDISILSSHITGTGVSRLAFQNDATALVWGVRNDGQLITLTYDRDVANNVRVGWARQVLGGYGDASQSAAVVEKITSIPSPDGTREAIWMVVKRFVNGQVTRYIEYSEKFFEEFDSDTDAYHLDCGLTYDSVATAEVSGLNHLEGEVVSILADGATHPDRTVSHGRITLDYSASKIHIGYNYASKGKMLRIEAGAADGAALGKTRRPHNVSFFLHRTGGFKIGMDFSTGLREYNLRTAADNMGQAVPLYSGIIQEKLDADYDTEGQICFQVDGGLPATLLAIMPQMDTQDR